MSIKVLQALAPNITLNLPVGQRNPGGRKKAADKLSKDFQNLIINIPRNELTINKYKELIYSLISPIKPPIEVVQVEGGPFIGAFQTTVAAEIEKSFIRILYNGYRVKLNLDEDKILSEKDIVVHETRHLFDSVCNPKKNLQRNLGYAPDSDIADRITEVIAFFKHPENSLNKKVLDEKLAGFDIEIIVGILQQVRHSIASEVNAYKDEFSFVLAQNKNPLDKIIYKFFDSFAPLNIMRSKLKIITKELERVLRSRHNL